jgi:hypothetical protein
MVIYDHPRFLDIMVEKPSVANLSSRGLGE